MHGELSPQQRQLILSELDNILASKDFAKAQRLQKLLTFIVHQALDNHQDELNGYRIGVAVFDRPESFDASSDTVVRVAAGRLRNKLKTYYDNQSAQSEVVIRLPLRSYVPEFSVNQAQGRDNQEGNVERVKISQSRTVRYLSFKHRYKALFAVLSLMILLVFWFNEPPKSNRSMEAAKEQVLNLEHEVARQSVKLAEQYYALEDYHNAALHYQKAVNAMPQNTEYLRWLGQAHYQLWQFGKAKAAFNQALETDTDKQNNIYDLVKDLILLGDYYRKTRQYPDALKTYQQAIDKHHANNPQPLLNAEIYRGLALSHIFMVHDDKAASFIQLAFEHYHRSGMDEPALLIKLHAADGIIKKRSQLNLEAIVDFVKATELATAHYGPTHSVVAEQRGHLAMMYSRTRQFEQSIAQYNQALKVTQSVFGQDHPRVARLYNNMANPLIKMKQYEQAKHILLKALDINSRIKSRYRIGYALNLYNLGLVQSLLNDNHAALQSLAQSLSLYIEAYGNNHPEVGEIWENMAYVSIELADPISAKVYFQNALLVYQENFGDTHKKSQQMQAAIATLATDNHSQ